MNHDVYPIPSEALMRRQKQRILDRIYDHHLRLWGGSKGNVFFISDQYPGVWMEHLYDGVSWADYMPGQNEISKNHIDVFLSRQTPEGQLPCYIWANEIGYGWTQECVSVGSVCVEAIHQNPQDSEFLNRCYQGVRRWVEWLCNTHMTQGKGLIEMFCGYDTGHDNSARLNPLEYPTKYTRDGHCMPGSAAPEDCDMADLLGLPEEAAEWRKRAEIVRQKMFEHLWDEKDQYFYDVDKHGKKHKIRSIYITNVFSEGVMDYDLGNEVFDRYIANPREFWTPYPLPAVSVSDPQWVQNLPGNSWGFYSQGLTALRSMRWMPQYGRTAEMEEIMRRWVSAWSHSTTTQFGQELHPITGEPSQCSQWYSSCMLYYLHAIRRLYGI